MRRTRTQDRTLAKRLLLGDEDAYAELFADHVPRLWRIVLVRIGGGVR